MSKEKMKNKKQKVEKIDPRVARQIEILKKHYVVDTEQKVINVDFSYDTAGEVFRDNINQLQVPMIEHELIDNVTYFFDRIPDDYQVALNYQIDDIEDYTYEDVAEAYFDEMELDHYLAYKRSKKKGLTVAILMIVGCIAIIVSTLCYTLDCFKSMNGQIIGYIIDCAAYAFIWEALGILFLYKDEELTNTHQFLDRLKSVSFSNKKGEAIVSRSKAEITESWTTELKKERIGMACYLVTGIVLAVLGSISIISFLTNIRSIDFSNNNFVIYISIHLVLSVFELLAGIGCISKYIGKGPMQKVVVPTMFVLAGAIIVDTILLFTFLPKSGKDYKAFIISGVFSLLVIIFMIVESIYFRKKSKK